MSPYSSRGCREWKNKLCSGDLKTYVRDCPVIVWRPSSLKAISHIFRSERHSLFFLFMAAPAAIYGLIRARFFRGGGLTSILVGLKTPNQNPCPWLCYWWRRYSTWDQRLSDRVEKCVTRRQACNGQRLKLSAQMRWNWNKTVSKQFPNSFLNSSVSVSFKLCGQFNATKRSGNYLRQQVSI